MLRNFINKKNIHLDYASTTPADPAVIRAMRPFLAGDFFNPSASYRDAQDVRTRIARHREEIARLFQVKPNEIVFTQGGTESNNLAILGCAKRALETSDAAPHMLFSSIEHPAVSECVPVLRKMGVEVDIVPVTASGLVDTQQLEKMLTERTVLVSAIMVSNETGMIQPIGRIASILKKYKNGLHRAFSHYPYLHTDASQAILGQEINVSGLGADLVSIDGSKIYGPKMSGALIRKQYVKIEPLLHGGGQEFGLRPGTEHAGAIAGLAKALERAAERRAEDCRRFAELKSLFLAELDASGIPYELNGAADGRSAAHLLNICIGGLNSDFAVIQLDELGINCSAMTACASAKGLPRSEIIAAMGKPECAASSLRFSFGRTSTPAHVRKAVAALRTVCGKQSIM